MSSLLMIDFSLASEEGVLIDRGTLGLGLGDSILGAVEWQGITLANFLKNAIEMYLDDVAAAMDEEGAGAS